jgi:transcriptional regulator with XRE-family HTH domain
MTDEDRADLGEYLRGLRASMTPPAAVSGARQPLRRVPGMRRQELSTQAGISVEYYTRLEQGRAPRPSREILAALARGFGLGVAERDHLFRLAGELPPEPEVPSEEVRPGLLRMLRGLDEVMPASVHDGRLDLLVSNAAAADFFDPLLSTGRYGRNLVHQCFVTEDLSSVLGVQGADELRRVATAELRTALSRYPGDEYLDSLRKELWATSPVFRAHWERAEVGTWRSAIKRLHHPTRGWQSFDLEMLHDQERDHWVMLYTLRADG